MSNANAPIKSDIARDLNWLAIHMADVAASMEYYAGVDEWGQHSRELIGAAAICRQWADEIEKGGDK